MRYIPYTGPQLPTLLSTRLAEFLDDCTIHGIPWQRAVTVHPDGNGVVIQWTHTAIQCWIDPTSYALQGPGDVFYDSRDVYDILPPLLQLLTV
jgi:hypothetical protein